MPDSSVSAVFSLLSLVFQLMTTEKTSQQYQSYVNMLLLNFRESHHRLMQAGTWFIIALSYCRRGGEGFASMKRSDLVKKTDDVTMEPYQAFIYAKKVDLDSSSYAKYTFLRYLVN